MTEIYKITLIEKNNDINDPLEEMTFLGLWEKDGNYIRNILWDYKQLTIANSGSISDTIKESGMYDFFFENLDSNSSIEFEIQLTNQKRGHCYPRIYKQICSEDDLGSIALSKKKQQKVSNLIPVDKNQLLHSLEQLTTLTDLLANILRTVFPNPANFDTYGFDIRNLIILTATEFEAQITGILRANNILPNRNFYTTVDFYKLKDVLKLHEYEVKFSNYPDIPILSPFRTWNSLNPTTSLEWYTNYNAIKHDRDNNFNKGRLIDLLNSISACYILLIAQYGNLQLIKDRLKNY